MALLMGLPIQDYGCYALSHALYQLHINQPQLFKKSSLYIVSPSLMNLDIESPPHRVTAPSTSLKRIYPRP
jgi:hypothetical protein